MGCPTDKPDFRKLASSNRVLNEESLTRLLSEMFETGYHIGIIYGGWTEQDNDKAYAKQFETKVTCECCSLDPTETLRNYNGSEETEE